MFANALIGVDAVISDYTDFHVLTVWGTAAAPAPTLQMDPVPASNSNRNIPTLISLTVLGIVIVRLWFP